MWNYAPALDALRGIGVSGKAVGNVKLVSNWFGSWIKKHNDGIVMSVSDYQNLS